MTTNTKQSGFTLVELAIVLVIIGLIVGGVLVGQDLIKAAAIRATVTQIENINAGATTFQAKYGGLPGDLMSLKADANGFNATSATVATIVNTYRDGTAGKGDGNGVIEACSSGGIGMGCETSLFWSDLAKARLLAGVFDGYSNNTVVPATTTPAAFGRLTLHTKLRDTAVFSVQPNNGRNWFLLGNQINAVQAAAVPGAITVVQNTAAASITPLEARGIDEKIDDGAPATGIVNAVTSTAFAIDAGVAAAANRCVNSGTTPTTYTATTDAFLNSPACLIGVRTSF